MSWKNIMFKKEKQIGFRGQEMSLGNSMAFESAMTSVSQMSPEAPQRLKAFLEKKK